MLAVVEVNADNAVEPDQRPQHVRPYIRREALFQFVSLNGREVIVRVVIRTQYSEHTTYGYVEIITVTTMMFLVLRVCSRTVSCSRSLVEQPT